MVQNLTPTTNTECSGLQDDQRPLCLNRQSVFIELLSRFPDSVSAYNIVCYIVPSTVILLLGICAAVSCSLCVYYMCVNLSNTLYILIINNNNNISIDF